MEKNTDQKQNCQTAIKALKDAIKDNLKKKKPLKTNTMRKFLILSGLIVLVTFNLIAQEGNNDFVVVGQADSDQNMVQIVMRYTNSQSVCFISDSNVSPIDQITSSVSGKSYENVHIFAISTANSLKLNGMQINAGNIEQYKLQLIKWKESISGKVIIHCTGTIDEKSSADMKLAFERYTGMEFIFTR